MKHDLPISLKDHPKRYTAADIEALTQGAVDRKMAENWHNRGLWLTPSEKVLREASLGCIQPRISLRR